MKIFVPMCDDLLGKHGEMTGCLVPFTPQLMQLKIMANSQRRDFPKKPRNWVPESNYREACDRLHEQ